MRIAAALHPLTFALFPVAALLAENIEMTYPAEGLRSAVVLACFALALQVAGSALYGDPGKASLAATLILASAYALGQVRLLVAPPATPEEKPFALAALFLWLLTGSLSAVLLRRARRMPRSVHVVLATIAVAALIQPLLRIVDHERQADLPWDLPSATSLRALRPAANPASARPDVYYVILDGYGRADVLGELYGIDLAPFHAELEARGFYIADEAMSNYAQTSLSLASSLNMSYLDGLTPSSGDISQREVARLIRSSEVAEVFRLHGYRRIAFASGYRRADLATVEVFRDARSSATSPFEALLLESSALWGGRAALEAVGLRPPAPGYDAYRGRIQANLRMLLDAASEPGPKFVFAHLLIPHPPFVFDPGGEPRYPDQPFRAADGDQFLGDDDDYIRGYREQVAFTNRFVLEFLDTLDAESGGEAVVILQGDHGPGSRLDWGDPSGTDMRERMSILLAIRLPAEHRDALYPSLTPVNLFRIVLNTTFRGSYPLLADQSWFSSWQAPYDFLPVDLGPDRRPG